MRLSINTRPLSFTAFRNDKPKKKKKRNESAENGASTEATAAAPQVGPDGQPIIQSKRLKKRLKQAKVQEKRKDEDNVRTIAYLSKWLENRTEWKFEKLRQIAIQKGILNASLIPDEHFTVALDYLATTKVNSMRCESVNRGVENLRAVWFLSGCCPDAYHRIGREDDRKIRGQN